MAGSGVGVPGGSVVDGHGNDGRIGSAVDDDIGSGFDRRRIDVHQHVGQLDDHQHDNGSADFDQ